MSTLPAGSSPKVVVCGDSVFDNAPYVGAGGRDMHSHLQEFADGWAIDFRAVDGAVCKDVTADQLAGCDGCEALVLSIGGNDALGHIDRFADPHGSTFLATALSLAEIQRDFRRNYRETAAQSRSVSRRMLAATIYRPRFHLDGYPAEIVEAIDPLLSIFNDVIQEEARLVGADLLDLRHVCVRDEDFANPIEPSDMGGRKISFAIKRWLEELEP